MAISIGGQRRYTPAPTDTGLIDPTTTAGVQPAVSGASGYTLTFSDEFASGTFNANRWIPWYPDTAFWNATTPGGHKTNTNEPQGYDESGITFDADGLKLTMRNSNAAVPELAYTSGMVCSYPAFGQTYGFFEARMKLVNAQGAWPAFWMDRVDQTWPPEIDIMENFAQPSFNLTTTHTYHPAGGGSSSTQYTWQVGVDDLADWHTYGARWESGRIRWYADGTLVKDYSNANVSNAAMYLICNLAGQPSDVPASGTLPISIHVRYIRAWSL